MHALDECSAGYDYLLLLQPTSPFRRAEDIDTKHGDIGNAICRLQVGLVVLLQKMCVIYNSFIPGTILESPLFQQQQQPFFHWIHSIRIEFTLS